MLPTGDVFKNTKVVILIKMIAFLLLPQINHQSFPRWRHCETKIILQLVTAEIKWTWDRV